MVELDREQRRNLNVLLEPFMHQLVLPTILRGHAPARCWSDAPESPSAALVWDIVNTFVFCVGDTSSSATVDRVGDTLVTELLPGAKLAGHELFHLQFAPEELQESLRRRLSGYDLSTKLLHSYARSPEDSGAIPFAGEGFSDGLSLARLTGDVLSSDLGNMDEVRYCVNACWRDRGRYLDEGIGCCITDRTNVASWCSTDYVIDGSADLYVETFSGYQRRGLATRAVSACIDACRSAGWTVHWHCWSDNRGSVRLAEKHGFKLASVSPVLRVRSIDE